MALTKCPRCELNYILDGGKYCKICRMEMKGEGVREELEMCSACGEHPVMPGKDVCLFCFKEMDDRNNEKATENSDENVPVSEEDAISIDPISTMDEIIPESDEEENGEMSLEAMGEEEDGEDMDAFDSDEDDDYDQMNGKRIK